MNFRIDPATPEDCRAIAQVHVLSWQHAYPDLLPAAVLDALSVERREAVWRASLATGEPQVLVARVDAGVCGFVAFGRSRDADMAPDCGEVWALYLAPDAWSKGIGRALWLAAWAQLREQGCTSASLWVIDGNRRAIAFYEAAGFVAEPASAKRFEIGGTMLDELRYRRGADPAASPAEVVQRQLDAYNARDMAAWLATYAADAEQFVLHGPLLAAGHDAMRSRMVERFAEPDLHAQLLTRTVMGHVVVDHERITRNFPDGLGTVEMLCVYEVVDGLIRKASFGVGARG